jgi:hypothetical protein
MGPLSHPSPVKDGDVAYTDERVARAITRYLVEHHDLRKTSTIWEPCAGDGAFVRELLALTAAPVLAHDLDPDAPIHRGVLDPRGLPPADGGFPEGAPQRLWVRQASYETQTRGVGWVVTNPAFTLLDDIIKFMAEICTDGFALLFLTQALNPVKRDYIWRDMRPVETVDLSPRSPFKRPRAKAKIEAAQAELARLEGEALFPGAGPEIPEGLRKLAAKKYNPRATDMREYCFGVWRPPFNAPFIRRRRLNWKTGEVFG